MLTQHDGTFLPTKPCVPSLPQQASQNHLLTIQPFIERLTASPNSISKAIRASPRLITCLRFPQLFSRITIVGCFAFDRPAAIFLCPAFNLPLALLPSIFLQ